MPGPFPGAMSECGPSSLTPVLVSYAAASFLCGAHIGLAVSSMHGNALAKHRSTARRLEALGHFQHRDAEERRSPREGYPPR